MKFDYLVVGAGLFGSVFAHEAKEHGKSVLVVDKRPNIAEKATNETKKMLLIALNFTILLESIFKEAITTKEYTPNSILCKLIVIITTIIPIIPRNIISFSLYFPVQNATINKAQAIYCTNPQIAYLFLPNK